MNNTDTPPSRADLLRQIEKSWNELQTVVASLTEQQLTRLTDAAGWTVKDHLIHLSIWEIGGLALLEGKSKREAMGILPEIWEQDFDVINAVIYQHYKDTPLDEALKIVRQNHQRMLTKLETMTENDLLLPYQHYHPDVAEDEPIIWWVVIATYDHFQEHMPWIKAIAEQ